MATVSTPAIGIDEVRRFIASRPGFHVILRQKGVIEGTSKIATSVSCQVLDTEALVEHYNDLMVNKGTTAEGLNVHEGRSFSFGATETYTLYGEAAVFFTFEPVTLGLSILQQSRADEILRSSLEMAVRELLQRNTDLLTQSRAPPR